MNKYEQQERWFERRGICGKEPLLWILDKLSPRLLLTYITRIQDYDQNRLDYKFAMFDEAAQFLWLQHFMRGLHVTREYWGETSKVCGGELEERYHRIGLTFYKFDIEDLPFLGRL